MIGKSLANGFQYTKLKYKQYFQFKYTTYVSFMFVFIQFIYQSLFLFCLLKLVLFSKFNSFLPNLLAGEHHKAILHTVKIARFFKKKQQETKQLFCYSLQLKNCAHYSLLVDITHYWLFRFLVGTQISSRSLVSVKFSEDILSCIVKTAIHKNQHH